MDATKRLLEPLDAFSVAAMCGYGTELNFTPFTNRAAWNEQSLLQGLVNETRSSDISRRSSVRTRLMYAAHKGDLTRMTHLIRMGARPELSFDSGSERGAALSAAATAGQLQAVQFLCNLRPGVTAGHHPPPLVTIDTSVIRGAVRGRHLAVLQYLLVEAPDSLKPSVDALVAGYRAAVDTAWLQGLTLLLAHVPSDRLFLVLQLQHPPLAPYHDVFEERWGEDRPLCLDKLLACGAQPEEHSKALQVDAADICSILERLLSVGAVTREAVYMALAAYAEDIVGFPPSSTGTASNFYRLFTACCASGVLDLAYKPRQFGWTSNLWLTVVACMQASGHSFETGFRGLLTACQDLKLREVQGAHAETDWSLLQDKLYRIALLVNDTKTMDHLLEDVSAVKHQIKALGHDVEAIRSLTHRRERDAFVAACGRETHNLSMENCKCLYMLAMHNPHMREEAVGILLQATSFLIESDELESDYGEENDDIEGGSEEATRLLVKLFHTVSAGDLPLDFTTSVTVGPITERQKLPGCDKCPLWVLICLYDCDKLRLRAQHADCSGHSILAVAPVPEGAMRSVLSSHFLYPHWSVTSDISDKYNIPHEVFRSVDPLQWAVALGNLSLVADIVGVDPTAVGFIDLYTAVIHRDRRILRCLLDNPPEYASCSAMLAVSIEVSGLPKYVRTRVRKEFDECSASEVAVFLDDLTVVSELSAVCTTYSQKGEGESRSIFLFATSAAMVHHLCKLAVDRGDPVDCEAVFQELQSYTTGMPVPQVVLDALKIEIGWALARKAHMQVQALEKRVEARLDRIEGMLLQLVGRTAVDTYAGTPCFNTPGGATPSMQPPEGGRTPVFNGPGLTTPLMQGTGFTR